MGEERIKLDFEQIAKANFDFLINKFKFKLKYSDKYIIKYSSNIVYLNIYHDKLSYELNIIIGLLPEHRKNGLYLTLYEIIKYFNIDTFIMEYYATIEKYVIEKYLNESSRIIQKYGKNILLGEKEIFINQLFKRKIEEDEMVKEENKKLIEKEASEAWNKHDYQLVYKIYYDNYSILNHIQKKRFEIAKKVIKKTH